MREKYYNQPFEDF